MYTKFLFILSFVSSSLFASDSDFKIVYVNPSTGQPAMLVFDPSVTNRPGPENAAAWMQQNLNASRSYQLRYVSSVNGSDGRTHIRYQQYYGRFPVESGQIILHSKNNRTLSLNGKFIPEISADTHILVTPDEAVSKAISLFPGAVFMWELPSEEGLLQQIRNNASATYRPRPEAVLISVNDSCRPGDFRLAWKMDIYSYEPHQREWIYIDAATGEVLDRESQICYMDRVGVAHTKYAGIRNITCDSIAADTYVLFDRTRGKGIHTRDARIIGTDSIREFTDDDNVWNNVNAFKDEVATDVHWGSAATYDYYKQFHNRSSYDDSDGFILSKVHVGNKFNNAYWSGSIAHYGDGDGINLSPLTSIDVVAHELTHGVTQYTAGLRYRNESGALNESFSDIFCKAVETWVDSAGFDWLIAGRITLKNDPFRDMSFPPNQSHPKYYFGKFYQKSGTFDNGGVHINSGVQNFWFYLLSSGGSGIRELDSLPYEVSSIGIEKAARIAYLTLSGSLFRESEYIDACYQSMDAAAALYGEGSNEYLQVRNAWFAVGLLSPEEVGARELSAGNGQWTVSPNPGSQHIRLNNPLHFAPVKAEIFDISGKLLMETKAMPGETVDVSSLGSGVYFIRIDGVSVLRWIRG